MLKVKNALKIVLKNIKNLEAEVLRLTDTLGRVLAQDLYSDCDIPGFDNSAMDGYAVKSADLKKALKNSPKVLEVVGELKAGDISKKVLKNNQAIRIMTGAPIPKGADSVIMVEDTQRLGKNKVNPVRSGALRRRTSNGVKIFKELERGENIRKAGEDIKKGELVIRHGTLLNSAHLGILASLGKTQVKVARRPKVAVLATGNEVVDVKEKIGPGKIRSSNTYTLVSQILKCGGIAKNLGIAKDSPAQLKKKIKQGFDCDLILTSGGVSAGDYDLVKDVLAKMGTEIKFCKVAIRPGKPLTFGVIEGIPVFGLPGNPVSSMVDFEIFVRPAILKMLGQRNGERKEMEAVVEEDIKKRPGLRYFLRANTRWHKDKYFTKTTGPQGSAMLKSFALANSLIILPEGEEFIERGSRLAVRFLD